jgi:hypothetical protein
MSGSLQLFWLELGLRRSDFVIGPLAAFEPPLFGRCHVSPSSRNVPEDGPCLTTQLVFLRSMQDAISSS